MKRNLLLIASFVFAFSYANATVFTIATSGSTYSPSTVNANMGDTLIITASASHPLVQISQTSWTSQVATPLAGGWGTKTAQYTHVIGQVGDIYFGCGNHIGMGMKGKVIVSSGVGIKAVELTKAEFMLAPNPSSNYTNLTYAVIEPNQKAVITVFDVTGKAVLNPSVSKDVTVGINTVSINTNELSTGLYFVQLNLNNDVYTKKLFVE